MVQRIDLRGQECPIPVIQTKKALESTTEDSVMAIVDSNVAKENIEKLAKNFKYPATVREARGEYYIEIFKKSGTHISESLDYKSKDESHESLTIMITKDVLGEGNRELGEVLMKGYLYTLTESTKVPKNLLLLNSGVKLTVEGSPVVSHLRKLEEKGVTVLSCGTCLDYYKVKNKLLVGGIGNMYDMVEKSNASKKTITL